MAVGNDVEILQRVTRIETLFEGFLREMKKEHGFLNKTFDKIDTTLTALTKRVRNVEIWKAKVVGAAAGIGALSGLVAALIIMLLKGLLGL